jgi:hypothetical protein
MGPTDSGHGMRVRFKDAVREGWSAGGRIAKPASAPPGYTPHTVVTEWLTLNCHGRWAAEGRGTTIEVRFSEPEDADQARRHFSYLMT